jgi:hypothetical protein
MYNEDILFLTEEEYDEALVGVASNFNSYYVACYDEDKCIQIIQNLDNISYDDAVEYFEVNVKGSYMGDNSPIFINIIDEEELL